VLELVSLVLDRRRIWTSEDEHVYSVFWVWHRKRDFS